MPTQVSRPPSTDPLPSSRVGADKYSQHDPMHPSCDPRAKFNMQHREALRLALGSILAHKRSSIPGSRSSSGTASPACSFSGSPGTYTPATPPVMPYTPSLDANNSQEHPPPRLHLSHPPYYPIHPPSKLGRVESHPDAPGADAPSSIPMPTAPPQHHSPPPAPPHPLFRSRSHNPSNPPSSRTSPRLQPTTPPLTRPVPTMTVMDTTDPKPSLPPPMPPVATTGSGDGGKINAPGNQLPPPSIPSSGDVPVPASAGYQIVATGPGRKGRPNPTPYQPHTDGAGSGGSNGAGTPRAKFIQTLQGKSAWDALIHGSFS